jgi:hypothetical protein
VEKMSGKETLMKKIPARKKRGAAAQAVNSETATEAIPVTDFQSHTKELLTGRFANIMEAMAQKSAEGSLAHTKYLFEIGGVREELQRQSENNGEPTLAELLLAEVRRHRGEETSSAEAMHTIEAGDKSEVEPTGDLLERGGNCGAKAE